MSVIRHILPVLIDVNTVDPLAVPPRDDTVEAENRFVLTVCYRYELRASGDRCQDVKHSGDDISALERCARHGAVKLNVNVLPHKGDGSRSVESLDRLSEASGSCSNHVGIDHVRRPQSSSVLVSMRFLDRT